MEEKKIHESKIVDVEVDKSNLELLKESYFILQKHHGLPSFEELNLDFQIEKIQEEETEVLVREIRRYVSEKFSTYLRFIETLIQPTNAPLFVFSMLKNLNTEDMASLQLIYKKLAKKEIEVITLDLKFNLEGEISFIKSSFDMWQELKEELLLIIEKTKKGWDTNGNTENNGRNYFG